MEPINSKNILKSVVEVIAEEQELAMKQHEILEKFDKAENLGLADDMEKISFEASRLDFKILQFFAKKAIVMTVYTNKNKDFMFN